MNEKNQKDQANPDFGFIMNQTAPEPKSKKLDKKLLVAIVLVVSLVALMIMGALLSAKRRVATVKTASNGQVTAAFVNYVSGNQDEKAYALLSTNLQKSQSGQTFTKLTGQTFRTYVDLTTCKTQSTTSAQKIIYKCTTKGLKTTNITINFSLLAPTDTGNPTIDKIDWSLK